MSRFWREPAGGTDHRDHMVAGSAAGAKIRRDRLASQWQYFVQSEGFVLQFVSLAQLRECLEFFSSQERKHPLGWHNTVEHEFMHWSQRLPLKLVSPPRRTRVARDLGAALEALSALPAAPSEAARRRRMERHTTVTIDPGTGRPSVRILVLDSDARPHDAPEVIAAFRESGAGALLPEHVTTSAYDVAWRVLAWRVNGRGFISRCDLHAEYFRSGIRHGAWELAPSPSVREALKSCKAGMILSARGPLRSVRPQLLKLAARLLTPGAGLVVVREHPGGEAGFVERHALPTPAVVRSMRAGRWPQGSPRFKQA